MSSLYRAKISQELLAQKNGHECFFSISMGNENQAGEKLKATVEWINQNFSFCIVNLADTLQRYNFEMVGQSPDQAYASAKALGDQWLKANGKILENLKVTYNLTRWDNWRYSPVLQTVKDHYLNLYSSDNRFSYALNEDINKFVDKYHSTRGAHLTRDGYFSGCLSYFLEELSVWTIVGRTGKYIKIYPAKPHRIAIDLSYCLYPAPEGIENIIFARLSFKKRGQTILKAAYRDISTFRKDQARPT